MKNFILAGTFILLLSSCTHTHKKIEEKSIPSSATATASSSENATPTAPPIIPTKAQAVLKTMAGSKAKGIIHFTEDGGKMKVETMVEGLKSGPHGFHIHEVGDCSKADFSSAGGHFNPTHSGHGSLDSKKRHAGDLGNLYVDTKGKANVTIVVEGLTMKPGAQSIIGKSVIIHKDKDDLKSQPAGNSGAREACGVIEAL